MDMLSYFLGRLAGGGTGGSGGSDGPVYTDLVYNDDGSITFIDDEGQEHIMECEYVDGRLEKVKIDEITLDAIYEENTDKLIKLGDINIEVGDYPSEIGEIETLIDNSGVLEDTEGSVSEKVEQLIDKAEKGKNDTLKSLFLNTLEEYTLTEEFTIEGMRFVRNKLKKLIAPNLIGRLSGYEFYQCLSIRHLDVGRIISFSPNAIIGCHQVQTIIMRNTERVVTLTAVFFNCNSILRDDYTYFCYFYVPKALLEDYKVATNWSNYANRFRAIEDYPEITGG